METMPMPIPDEAIETIAPSSETLTGEITKSPLNALGEFYTLINKELGQGEDTPPFILYSSLALAVYDKEAGVPTEKDPGDVDIFTSEEGIRRFLNLVTSDETLKNRVTIKEGSPSRGSRLTGEETLLLECTLQTNSGSLKLEMFADIAENSDGSTSFGGMLEGLSPKDVTALPYAYKSALGETQHTTITIFKPDAVAHIYRKVMEESPRAFAKGNLREIKSGRPESATRAYLHNAQIPEEEHSQRVADLKPNGSKLN